MELLSYVSIPSVFTKEECARIVDEFSKLKMIHSDVTDISPEVKKRRKSRNIFIPRNNDTDWIFQRLTSLVHDLNKSKFKFNLDFNCIQDIQFTKYSPGDYYDWHVDIGPTMQTCCRKMSLTVQLTDDSKYNGGNVEIGNIDEDAFKVSREIGSVCIFSSIIRHRVTEIEDGTRYSLVAWATGYPFI